MLRSLPVPWQGDLWPPSTPLWTAVFFVLFFLIGLLSFWRKGRILMVVTAGCLAAGLSVVFARSGTGAAVVSLLWMGVASAALGDFALRLSRVERTEALAGTERLGLSLLVGFGLLSLAAAGLAGARLLNRVSAMALLAVCTLPWLACAGRWRGTWQQRLSCARLWWSNNDLRWPAAGLACLAVCFGFSLMWALAPSVHWDALASHLPVASAYASAKGFGAVSELWYSYLSGQSHLLFALALALVGQPLPALTHFSVGLIITLLVFALACRLKGRVAGWLAALAFASMPMVVWEAGTAYLDLFAAGYVFGSMYALLRWREARSSGWLLLAGLLGGMAAGTKLSAGLFLIGPALYVLVVALRSGGLGVSARAIASYGIPLVVLTVPWLIRNWLWTGNPVYPMFGRLFGNAELESFPFNWDTFGVGRGLRYLLRLPYDLVVHGKAYDEAGWFAFGVVPLAAFASLLPQRGQLPWKARGAMLLFWVTGITAWFASAQVGRYLLPLMPLMAVLAALPWSFVSQPRFGLPRVTAGVLAALGLFYLGYSRSVGTLWNYNLPEGYPYRHALGWENRERFLERALRVYGAQRYINSHCTESCRVFSPTSQVRFYSVPPLDDPIYNLRTITLGRLPPGDALIREMRTRGYNYLLVDQLSMESAYAGSSFADQDFLKTFTDLVYSQNNVLVYRLRKLGRQLETRPTELATNGGFDQLTGDGLPFAWVAFGTPNILTSPGACHSPPACAAVGQEDGFYQRVPAKPGRLYTVSVWARAERPGQLVWLQVLWLDSAIRIVDTGITEVAADVQWRRFSASFTAVHPSTAFVQVYARAARGSRVLVDDVSLTEGW